ncbi:MAG: DUF4340 domain-containing protein [Alteromonadaceae bacterium]|nr:DUF4340 domain-containing protein [Alteromonadaceae bacterium]
MNKNNLYLIAIIVIAVLATVLFSGEKAQTTFDREALFPELLDDAKSINKVSLTSSDGEWAIFVKKDSQWLSENFSNYPAKSDEIATLINALSAAKLDEPKTTKAENYARLGLGDLENKDSQATLLKLHSPDKSWQVLIGNKASSGSGVYIRKPNEQQTWLTKAEISLPSDDKAWLDSKILDFTSDDIQTISRNDGTPWSITHSETASASDEGAEKNDKNWELTPKPDERELKYDSILKNLVDDIVGLSFNDISVKDTADALEERANFTVSLKDDEVIVKFLSNGEKDYVEFSSSEKEALWENWRYEVSKFTANQIVKTVEDFLQEPSAPVAEAETESN